MGRVKVEYYWNGRENESDWMRVVQQYAGSAKGMYFRPEIGKEVFVGFKGGNAECPYVSGTYYNGREMPEFFDENNSIKGWKLRFGMLFKFIEKVGIWLSDPSGNEINFDQAGKNMTLTTKGTLTLNCEDLVINVNKNMTTNVILTKNEIVGGNSLDKIGGVKHLGVGKDFNAIVEGKYFEHIKGDLESKTDKERHEIGKEGINNNTEGNLSKNAQKDINNNSGEQTTQN